MKRLFLAFTLCFVACDVEPEPAVWTSSTFTVEQPYIGPVFDICTEDGSALTLIERHENNRRIWTSALGCLSDGTALYPVELLPGREYVLVSTGPRWVITGFEPVP